MMNDRFKFRFWHKPTNKMLNCYGFNEHCTFANTLDGIGTEYNPCATKDCELMQCTGLKDKNGKLIYEGDVVKINTWFDKIVPDDFEYRYKDEKGFALYQIFFNQEKTRFEAKCIKYTKEKPYRCFLLDYVPTRNEVIGNIYENKELLNDMENN